MTAKKSIAIALAAALALGASGAALATTVNVGGVSWNTDSPFDLTLGSASLIETSVANVGNVLQGYGLISQINQNSNFCANCQLAFTFQYTVANTNPSSLQLAFDHGTLNFFVIPANSFNGSDPTNISSGTPWLTLTGVKSSVSGYPGSFAGDELFSTAAGSISNPITGSVGSGYVDATGGPAAKYMQTHSQATGYKGLFADFLLTTNFNVIPTGPFTAPNGVTYSIEGGGTMTGKSMVPVPEPGEIGLMGLGLGILGLFFWRRRKEDEKRA